MHRSENPRVLEAHGMPDDLLVEAWVATADLHDLAPILQPAWLAPGSYDPDQRDFIACLDDGCDPSRGGLNAVVLSPTRFRCTACGLLGTLALARRWVLERHHVLDAAARMLADRRQAAA